ncbi:MAG TPA: aldo/keto reductase [Polyangiaceae bacterium]|jgi:aryl-alcohol dehydrogenase-like predicted oxidoreductase|nr:aldo/keto reductase [Polyangiaceae bacterium]
MKLKRLGRTGLQVSELCLGTMTYGGKGFWAVIGKLGQDEVLRQLKTAMDAGVNFIDTADVYHEGESERLLGQAIKAGGIQRQSLVIATKVRGRVGETPNDVGLSRKHIYDAIDASLQRLGTDHVDLYQIHGVDTVTPIEETVDALDDIVRAGKVRYVGFCNLPAYKAMQALAIAERTGAARFVSAQMFYTIASRDIEREIVPLAQEEGLGILPWSPLAGGLLSGKYKDGGAAPEDARRASFDFPIVDKPRAFACVEAMRPIAAAHGVSVAQIALAYCLHKPFITSVIIGAKTQDQLVDNLAATKVKLTSDELAALDRVSALPVEYPGWMVEFQNRDQRIEFGKD